MKMFMRRSLMLSVVASIFAAGSSFAMFSTKAFDEKAAAAACKEHGYNFKTLNGVLSQYSLLDEAFDAWEAAQADAGYPLMLYNRVYKAYCALYDKKITAETDVEVRMSVLRSVLRFRCVTVLAAISSGRADGNAALYADKDEMVRSTLVQWFAPYKELFAGCDLDTLKTETIAWLLQNKRIVADVPFWVCGCVHNRWMPGWDINFGDLSHTHLTAFSDSTIASMLMKERHEQREALTQAIDGVTTLEQLICAAFVTPQGKIAEIAQEDVTRESQRHFGQPGSSDAKAKEVDGEVGEEEEEDAEAKTATLAELHAKGVMVANCGPQVDDLV